MNLVNASQAQQLNEQQAQGALHACIAQQQMVQNMQQRNAMAHDLNLQANIQAQRTANPTGYANTRQERTPTTCHDYRVQRGSVPLHSPLDTGAL